MKLFIINKSDFEFDTTFEKTQKEIHKKAFNELQRCVVCFEEAPLEIRIHYQDCIFEFVFIKQKNDFFIYKYVN